MENTNVQLERGKALAALFGEVQFWCHFIPLLTTLAWAIYAIPNLPIWICDFVLFPMMCIGWLAALIARPGVILGLAAKLIGGGFTIGLMILLIPINFVLAIVGAGLGLMGFLLLVGLAPAAVTLYCFFTNK